jgi:type III secretory pathway component EscV
VSRQSGLHGWVVWCGLLVAVNLVMLEISILYYDVGVGVNLTLSVVLLLFNRCSLIPWYIVSSEE